MAKRDQRKAKQTRHRSSTPANLASTSGSQNNQARSIRHRSQSVVRGTQNVSQNQKASVPSTSSNSESTCRWEDKPEFDEMMRKHKHFFSNKLLYRKDLQNDEFRRIILEVMQIEKENNKMRHQFLIRLVGTKFFMMNGPVSGTLMRMIQRVPGTNTTDREMIRTFRLLLELLQELLVRIPHYNDTFAYVTSIFALMRLIQGIDTSLGENMREVESALTQPELLMNVTHDPDVSWSSDVSFITEPILPPIQKFLNEPLPERFVNKIKGPYQSAAHYLETWFRLMQEDFISPLRTAILAFKQVRKFDEKAINMRLDGGYYFRFTKVLSTEQSRGKVIQLLQFSVEKLKNVDWTSTDRLRPEVLVIFSNDNFDNAVYGVVHSPEDNRPPKPGTVWVHLADGPLQFTGSFDGIQPMPFYEAYRCVLQRLKIVAMATDRGVMLPLENHLVKCDKSDVYPDYITTATTLKLPNGSTVRVGELSRTMDLKMDHSQRDALQLVFTNKLALIQGPPGTGKSYVGAHVVDILMANKYLWQKHGHGCIMLMAFTNHAIDQFIVECEEMGMDMSGTVRLGSRGNERMNKYTLRNRRAELKNFKEYAPMTRETGRIWGQLKDCERVMKDIQLHLKLKWFDFPTDKYMAYMGPSVRDQIEAWYGKLDHDVVIRWIDDGKPTRKLPHSNDLNACPIISFHEARNLENKYPCIAQLSANERKCLFRFWCETARADATECLKQYQIWEDHLKIQLDNHRRLQDIAVVRRCDIIAMTTTGACKHSHLVEAMKPTIVLVEEAAEVLESHIVAPLTTGCKHLILIGDHQQLRPSIAEFQLERRNMSISLFERLIMNNLPNRQLQIQHRMHPDISGLLVPHIYPSLKNHEKVHAYPAVKGVSQRMVFLCHDNYEKQVGEKASKQNDFEADYLVHLCRYLLQQGYSPKDITILVTYAGQERLIKTQIQTMCLNHPEPMYTEQEKLDAFHEEFKDVIALKQDTGKKVSLKPSDDLKDRVKAFEKKASLVHEKKSKINDVRVSTVDNYQGEESKIILLSFVRSNAQCNIGFLKWSNRICVALSRAKHGFYAVGNFQLFTKNQKSDLWKKLCTQMNSSPDKSKCVLRTALRITCQNHGTERFVTEGKSFIELAPEGGCTEVCIYRLKCGHKCTKSCHSDDQDHVTFICKHPCPSQLSCGHSCERVCSKDGDDKSFFKRKQEGDVYRQCKSCAKNIYCSSQVRVESPCGHIGEAKCSTLPKYKCARKVQFTLPCGHDKTAPCYSDINALVCLKQVDITLGCGHLLTKKCHQNIIDCTELVTLNLTCGHQKSVKCYASQDEHQCTTVVQILLPCLHSTMIECCQQHSPIKCTEMVSRTLPCQHIQTKICHEEWSKDPCSETIEVELKCGHKQKTECHKRRNTTLIKCELRVIERLTCGHDIEKACHNSNPVCTQQETIVKNCGHYKRTQCSETEKCQREPCTIRIEKELVCGHSVTMQCFQKNNPRPAGELCPQCIGAGSVVNDDDSEVIRPGVTLADNKFFQTLNSGVQRGGAHGSLPGRGGLEFGGRGAIQRRASGGPKASGSGAKLQGAHGIKTEKSFSVGDLTAGVDLLKLQSVYDEDLDDESLVEMNSYYPDYLDYFD